MPHPSVARVRLRRAAKADFAAHPAAYEVQAADLYATVAGPPIPGGAQPVYTSVPAFAAEITFGSMIGPDGTFAPLSYAETIFEPRIDAADRIAGCGFDFFLTPAIPFVLAGLGPAMAASVSPALLASQCVDFVISRIPDDMLMQSLDSGPARMLHARSLQHPVVLDASNVAIAIDHNSVFRSAITAEVSGSEALRLVGQIVEQDLAVTALTLSAMSRTQTPRAASRT